MLLTGLAQAHQSLIGMPVPPTAVMLWQRTSWPVPDSEQRTMPTETAKPC
jgi:hypothetical protein